MHRRHPRTICPVFLALVACAGLLAAMPPPYQIARPLPEPTLFGEGVISTGEFESHPAFTSDGRTLYFVRSTPEFTGWTIYVTHHTEGRWSPPKVAPFSGKHRDADPFISADGRQLYFISDRPVDDQPRQDMDIWVMDRAKSGDWGTPRNLGAPVNTAASEWFPTLAANGTLYFGSGRPGGHGKIDLYRARRAGGKFVEPENLGPGVNSAAHEYEGFVAPDESFLLFMAGDRPDSLGGEDLYISEQKDGKWTPAKNLGPKVNGPGLEISPYLSPDGKYFFFSSARKDGDVPAGRRPNRPRNGLGDIYQMDLDALRALAK
jgi:Tol biopolymer transport system component